MVEAGCGEYYLNHTGPTCCRCPGAERIGVTVSVKFRIGVAPDDRALAVALWKTGADILHIDLMDAGSAKLRQIPERSLLIIANNSITNFDRMREMLSHGADLVSLARQSDKRTLAGLDARNHPFC